MKSGHILFIQSALLLSVFCLHATSSAPVAAQSENEESASNPEGAEQEEEGEADAGDIDLKSAEKLFRSAFRQLTRERYRRSADLFFKYMDRFGQAAPSYEWARYFLGESLQQLGYFHASVYYYYEVAKTRSEPLLLADALRHLEAISNTRPFSERLVDFDLLYGTEFGDLPPDLSNWVHYRQGRLDLLHGFNDWSGLHFQKVEPGSPYADWVNYTRAVVDISAAKTASDTRAAVSLRSLAEKESTEPRLRNRSLLALARLHFDQHRFHEAWEYYNRVSQIELSYEQAQLLLEKAWTLYALKKYKKALGLLHALGAPSYREYFIPDIHLLRGLILKDLCQYIESKRAIRGFRTAYDMTLRRLRSRMDLEKITPIVLGTRQQGSIGRRTELLLSLQRERKKIFKERKWKKSGLRKALTAVYDLELREQVRRWRREFRGAGDRSAERLLETEEEIEVLDYEIGLDIVSRLQRTDLRHARDRADRIPIDSSKVYYEFDGEYWNDELHDYRYFVQNRCLNAGPSTTGGHSEHTSTQPGGAP